MRPWRRRGGMPDYTPHSQQPEETEMTSDAETWVPARALLMMTLGAFIVLAILAVVTPS